MNAAPDIALFGTIAGAYVLNQFMPVFEIIKSPFSYVGWLLIIVGVMLTATTLAALRKHASSDVVHTSKTLITDGLFALSRNPLYASELLIVIGVAIILGSLSALISPFVYVLIVGSFVIPFEERQLREKFGSKYKVYTRSVRRWV